MMFFYYVEKCFYGMIIPTTVNHLVLATIKSPGGVISNSNSNSNTPNKPVTMKLSKIRGKPQKIAKNRRIQRKYRGSGFGNTFIRFLGLENGILKKKIIILDPIEKKLVAPPMAMAAILDFGLWSPKATPAIVLPVHSVLYNP